MRLNSDYLNTTDFFTEDNAHFPIIFSSSCSSDTDHDSTNASVRELMEKEEPMKKKSWLILAAFLALGLATATGLQACGKGSKDTTFYGAGS